MTTVICPIASVFQEARNRVQSEIDLMLQCLNNKKVEMFNIIKEIEDEYLGKQKQKLKKISEINKLITQTEELADNSLLGVQNRIIKDLQKELSIASIQESDCRVEFEWGFSRDVISKINSITLKRLDTDKDEDRTSRKCPPNPEGSDIPNPEGSDIPTPDRIYKPTPDRTHIVPKEHVRSTVRSVPSSPLARSCHPPPPKPKPGTKVRQDSFREQTEFRKEQTAFLEDVKSALKHVNSERQQKPVSQDVLGGETTAQTIEPASKQCELRSKGSKRKHDRNTVIDIVLGGLQKHQGLNKSTQDQENSFSNRKSFWETLKYDVGETSN